MPSIIDLVSEYYQLDEQRTAAGGELAETSELRYQCLKFFLEFDMVPPYMYAAASAQTAQMAPDMITRKTSLFGPGDDTLSKTVDKMFSATPSQPSSVALGWFDTENAWQGGGKKSLSMDTGPEPGEKPAIPKAEAVPPPEAEKTPPPAAPVKNTELVSTPSRVTLHFVDGDVRRGVVKSLRNDSSTVVIFGNADESPEAVQTGLLKAIFVIGNPGALTAGEGGRPLDITFKDGRAIKGVSADYSPDVVMFTLIPEPRQGNIDRVIIVNEAVDEAR
ncbi:MAG: hypothetical protein WC889_13485 [Myxococcota bacterium]|jgi:hypothetical protein